MTALYSDAITYIDPNLLDNKEYTEFSFSYQPTTKILRSLGTAEDLQAERILRCLEKAWQCCQSSLLPERIYAIATELSPKKDDQSRECYTCLMCKLLI